MDYQVDREKATQLILEAESAHKVVVAGPGTGKTHLFRRVCKATGPHILAITFINNLANDLERALGDVAECCTFHAFCKKLIYHLPVTGIDTFTYFPQIEEVLKSDRSILEPELDDLQDAFEEFKMNDRRITFFLQRAHYYKAVGHTDGVFQVVQFLRGNPDKIPRYNMVLVDEYQDFNMLEAEMIRVLAQESPTLIVGDDDQALYDFKHASPDFLRHLSQDYGYELFELPYCSRCTEVIVEATNQIVAHAVGIGLLKGRMSKLFKCYLPGKEEDNRLFPKIVHAKCSVQRANAPYVSRYIYSEISHIVDAGYRPEFTRGVWDFIVAGPSHLLRGLADTLLERFRNTFHSKAERGELQLHDCYLELMRDRESQIGWRGLLNFWGQNALQEVILKSASMDCPIRDLIPKSIREDALHTTSLLSRLKEGDAINAFEETRLIELFQQDLERIRTTFGFVENLREESTQEPRHSIRISSILGCKGLTANYVFLVGLNNGILPTDPDSPADDEVRKLIVGITRARKKCYLISVRNLFGERLQDSEFIRWVDSSLLENLYVDKKFLEDRL